MLPEISCDGCMPDGSHGDECPCLWLRPLPKDRFVDSDTSLPGWNPAVVPAAIWDTDVLLNQAQVEEMGLGRDYLWECTCKGRVRIAYDHPSGRPWWYLRSSIVRRLEFMAAEVERNLHPGRMLDSSYD